MTESELCKTGLKTVRRTTGDPGWIRHFAMREDGCQVGRLSFHDGKLYSAKWYKTCMRRVDFDDSDFEQAKLERYLATGVPLTRTEYDEAVALAIADAAEDKRQKLAAREDMSERKRKAIKGLDPRLLLHRRMSE